MLLDLSAERSDFVCSFLSQSVQPFALLSEDRDFVLSLGPHSFSRVLGFDDAALQFFVFATDEFELVLEFSYLTCRKSEVLLGIPYLVAKTAVLAEQFLNSLFIAFRFLSRSAELIFVVIEFSTEPLRLDCRQSKVFLVLLHLSSERPDFSVLFLDDRVESLTLLGQNLNLVLTLSG